MHRHNKWSLNSNNVREKIDGLKQFFDNCEKLKILCWFRIKVTILWGAVELLTTSELHLVKIASVRFGKSHIISVKSYFYFSESIKMINCSSKIKKGFLDQLLPRKIAELKVRCIHFHSFCRRIVLKLLGENSGLFSLSFEFFVVHIFIKWS